jgi:hypothetical protein
MEVGWSTLRVWRWIGRWSTAGVRPLAEGGAELLDQVCQHREITRNLVDRSLVEVQAEVDVEDLAGEAATDFCFRFCLFLCASRRAASSAARSRRSWERVLMIDIMRCRRS